MTFDYTPGKWHTLDSVPLTERQYTLKYGTPKSWFRKSVPLGTGDGDIYADEQWITNAAVFARGTDVSSLFESIDWGIVVYWPGNDFIVVLASSNFKEVWTRDACALGARAWYIVEEGVPYRWVQKVHRDDTANTVQPREASKSGKKGINHEEVADDIRRGYYSATEIAAKYGISKQMIVVIRRKFKIPSARDRARSLGVTPTQGSL